MLAQRIISLQHHLHYNFVPPVDPSFISAAEKAIDEVNAGRYTTKIDLPNGRVLTAGEVVEGLHLDGYIDDKPLGEELIA